jgi:hypothetical protein
MNERAVIFDNVLMVIWDEFSEQNCAGLQMQKVRVKVLHLRRKDTTQLRWYVFISLCEETCCARLPVRTILYATPQLCYDNQSSHILMLGV